MRLIARVDGTLPKVTVLDFAYAQGRAAGDAGPPAVGVERQQQAVARLARGRGPESDVGRAHGPGALGAGPEGLRRGKDRYRR